MPPIAIAQLIMQFLPYGIRFTEAMINAMHKENPSKEDWLAAVAVSQTPFRQGIDISKLIPDPVAPTPGSTTVTVTTEPPVAPAPVTPP